MRIFVAILLTVALFTVFFFYSLISPFVVVANALIIWFWAVFYNRYQYLPVLGLIGTLVGLFYAFMSVDPTIVGDVELTKMMIGSTINGVAVSITTTLTGAILWLTEDWYHEDGVARPSL